MAEGELTPEQLAEQIKALKVSDLLLSTVSTLGQLAYVKVDANQLDEARLAIDSIAALLPSLEGHVDEQLLRDFNQMLANVRLSYASAMSAVQDSGRGQEVREAASESAAHVESEATAAAETGRSVVQDSGPGQEGQADDS